MDTVRQWHFGFEDYYDVYIWDASPGRKYHYLQQKLEEVSYAQKKLATTDIVDRRLLMRYE
jgi:hypothetical protein